MGINSISNELVLTYIKDYRAFIFKHASLVKQSCKRLELDDIIQTIYLAVLQAGHKYNGNSESNYVAYFSKVVINTCRTIVKTYFRQKNRPFNESISLDEFVNEEEKGTTYSEFVKDSDSSLLHPEVYLRNQEFVNKIEEIYESSDSFEKKVLQYYFEGKDIAMIATLMKKSQKTIYSVIARFKDKIK